MEGDIKNNVYARANHEPIRSNVNLIDQYLGDLIAIFKTVKSLIDVAKIHRF